MSGQSFSVQEPGQDDKATTEQWRGNEALVQGKSLEGLWGAEWRDGCYNTAMGGMRPQTPRVLGLFSLLVHIAQIPKYLTCQMLKKSRLREDFETPVLKKQWLLQVGKLSRCGGIFLSFFPE